MMSFTLSKNAGHLEVFLGWMLLPELPEGIIGLALKLVRMDVQLDGSGWIKGDRIPMGYFTYW